MYNKIMQPTEKEKRDFEKRVQGFIKAQASALKTQKLKARLIIQFKQNKVPLFGKIGMFFLRMANSSLQMQFIDDRRKK